MRCCYLIKHSYDPVTYGRTLVDLEFQRTGSMTIILLPNQVRDKRQMPTFTTSTKLGKVNSGVVLEEDPKS